ncbi:MAG: DUF3488 domain-containing protein [Streptomycetaceae bacterium]|nr:DUF3488 domain-containing protein [Streptomycetaceae bacterium]
MSAPTIAPGTASNGPAAPGGSAAAERTAQAPGSGAPRSSAAKRGPKRSGSAARATRFRRMSSLVPVAAFAATAGFAYHRVFGLGQIVPAVAVSATVPVVLVLLWTGCVRLGDKPRPLFGSFAISALAWLIAVSATLYRDDAALHLFPEPGLIRRIGSDVLDAPRGILTTVLPAPDDSDLMVLVSVTVWIAAWAGAELALRTDAPALPPLPGLLMLAVPVALSTGAPGDNTWVLTAAVGTAALVMVCRAPGRRSPLRLLMVGAPWVAVLAVLAGFVAPHLPGSGGPPDLRDRVSPPPPVALSAVNPLDRISAWLLEPDEPLFTVRGPADEDRYWRLTVLDKYDGTTWYPVTGLRPTGGRVPESAEGGSGTTRSVQTVTLDKLDGMWLPAADRPSEVDAASDVELAVDPDSGAVATGSRLKPGMRYQVVSNVPKFDPDSLQWLPTVADPNYTALPDYDESNQPIPAVEEFRRIATDATKGSTFPYQQALRLADWLRGNHKYDRTAVPGHSYRNLQFFLESSKEGTSEQFASAFAVLARSIGLPTRVVVGFSRGTQQPDGSWRVDTGDVMAWPEVEFAGVGWVPFYPTPGQSGHSGAPKNNPDNQSTGNQQPQPIAPVPSPQPQSRAEKDAEIASQERPVDTAAMPEESGDDGIPLWWWAVPLAVLLAAALSQAGLAFAAPGIIRRRRSHGPPDERVFGAWKQIGDRLTELGMPGDGSLTVREVASYGEDHLPTEVGSQLRPLANLVNDVAYADRTADPTDADEAWRISGAVEEAVRRSELRPNRRARLRERLSPKTIAASLRKEGD